MAYAMNRETDMPMPETQAARAYRPGAEVPLDFLVNALNRAVIRKQAAQTEETEYRA